MKIRLGFVSNSSSSSYTCEVCDNIESGMDCSLEDLGMIECEHGHIMCDTHITDQVKAQMDDYLVESEYGHKLKETVCPLCMLKQLSISDELMYYRRKLKTDNEKTKEEIQQKFKTYADFKASI